MSGNDTPAPYALVALSLALCVVTCVLWIRSYRSARRFEFVYGGVLWGAVLWQGDLTIDNSQEVRLEHALWQSAFNNLKQQNDRDESRLAEIETELDDHNHRLTPENKRALEQDHRRLDALTDGQEAKMSYGGMWQPISPKSHSIRLAIPAGISLIPPALFAGTFCIRRLQARNRLRNSLCRKCGYDLRPTSGGCPECGKSAPALLP